MKRAEHAGKRHQLTMHPAARSEPDGAPAELRESETEGPPRPGALAYGELRGYREAAPFISS
jgi:hypothetical protein